MLAVLLVPLLLPPACCSRSPQRLQQCMLSLVLSVAPVFLALAARTRSGPEFYWVLQPSGFKPLASPAHFSVTRRCVPDATPPRHTSCSQPAFVRAEECCNLRTGFLLLHGGASRPRLELESGKHKAFLMCESGKQEAGTCDGLAIWESRNLGILLHGGASRQRLESLETSLLWSTRLNRRIDVILGRLCSNVRSRTRTWHRPRFMYTRGNRAIVARAQT